MAASASDAFHLVIPSMPGYGFSGKPTTTGWDPVRIARAWVVLMKRLGYTRFVAQGGDWGDRRSRTRWPSWRRRNCSAFTSTCPATVPPEIAKALQSGDPPPSGLSADEKRAFEQLERLFTKRRAYAQDDGTRPQTLYGLADSPVGLGGLDA